MSQPAVKTDPLERWVVQLRIAVLVLMGAVVLLGPTWLGLATDLISATVVIGVALVTHVALLLLERKGVGLRARDLGFFVDVVAIACLLAFSGGPANPFSVVFMVYVAVGASVLPARSAWALAGVAAVGFGALFAIPATEPTDHHHHAHHDPGEAYSAHLEGMLVAFVAAAVLVAIALTRTRKLLAERDAELARVQARAEEDRRFAALGTLAAGTAHELSTPLGTIAVIAGELADVDDAEVKDFARTVAAQVRRCRDILTKLQSGGAGENAPASPLAARIRHAVADWSTAHPDVRVTTSGLEEDVVVAAAASDIEAAICALLDNAEQAVRDQQTETPNADELLTPIRVSLEHAERWAAIRVVDEGRGFPEEIRDRLGEPFVTTKDPGQGMGLGLFLARSLAERSGGSLLIRDNTPRGADVSLRLGLSTQSETSA